MRDLALPGLVLAATGGGAPGQHGPGQAVAAAMVNWLPHIETHNIGELLTLLAIALALVSFGGLMSGLTLGLLSLDDVDLEVVRRSGTPMEQKYAAAVLPLVEQQHLLLVTLLLCNAAAMEALPLVLDRIVDPVTAVVLSVTLVLVFGEVLPQAVCSRHGMAIGAKSAWLVRVLMLVCYPVAYPAFVDVHDEIAGHGGELTHDEAMIIGGVLGMIEKSVRAIMTPLDKTFMLAEDAVLDSDTLITVMHKGFSRIPVHAAGTRERIIGLLLVKNLIMVDPNKSLPLKAIPLRDLPVIRADTMMSDMLNHFRIGRSHLTAVVENNEEGEKVIGVVTLEDVLQQILQGEIADETPAELAREMEFVRRQATTHRLAQAISTLRHGQPASHAAHVWLHRTLTLPNAARRVASSTDNRSHSPAKARESASVPVSPVGSPQNAYETGNGGHEPVSPGPLASTSASKIKADSRTPLLRGGRS
eukprot:jgi/Chlat1/8698/Chrsp88S08081